MSTPACASKTNGAGSLLSALVAFGSDDDMVDLTLTHEYASEEGSEDEDADEEDGDEEEDYYGAASSNYLLSTAVPAQKR
ncbi:hypothetical protein B0H14DRAFT_3454019 [Mycena olivaceomarginata]|nr:hypothetical protein B0H14DRAFT_3454019 [Mycena olivaceomarginata]